MTNYFMKHQILEETSQANSYLCYNSSVHRATICDSIISMVCSCLVNVLLECFDCFKVMDFVLVCIVSPFKQLADNSNILWPGHHYQKFNAINRRLWLPILIAHFSAWPFLNSWLQLFYTRVGFHTLTILKAYIIIVTLFMANVAQHRKR